MSAGTSECADLGVEQGERLDAPHGEGEDGVQDGTEVEMMTRQAGVHLLLLDGEFKEGRRAADRLPDVLCVQHRHLLGVLLGLQRHSR